MPSVCHVYMTSAEKSLEIFYYKVTLSQPKQFSYVNVSVADPRPSSGLTSSVGHQ